MREWNAVPDHTLSVPVLRIQSSTVTTAICISGWYEAKSQLVFAVTTAVAQLQHLQPGYASSPVPASIPESRPPPRLRDTPETSSAHTIQTYIPPPLCRPSPSALSRPMALQGRRSSPTAAANVSHQPSKDEPVSNHPPSGLPLRVDNQAGRRCQKMGLCKGPLARSLA
jgi:hypothetical protein